MYNRLFLQYYDCAANAQEGCVHFRAYRQLDSEHSRLFDRGESSAVNINEE